MSDERKVHTELRRADGEWKIVKHSRLMGMPIAVPAAP
jgi:hypothetical protein